MPSLCLFVLCATVLCQVAFDMYEKYIIVNVGGSALLRFRGGGSGASRVFASATMIPRCSLALLLPVTLSIY